MNLSKTKVTRNIDDNRDIKISDIHVEQITYMCIRGLDIISLSNVKLVGFHEKCSENTTLFSEPS